jgi:pre-mRNA-splicing factor ISY1
MARNEEKAMSMLNRWLRVQSGEEFRKEERRPFLASQCETLAEAEKWRRQILTEISKKVSEIQNPGLGEFKIRDLNDLINKLVREKGHWEKRILELGGPNYMKVKTGIVDADGNEMAGTKGYKYYGAARELPGVRELFSNKNPAPAAKRSRAEMYKCADAWYFGYRDEDDALLAPLEKSAEEEAIATAVLEWTERQANRAAAGKPTADSDDDVDKEDGFVAHVVVPSAQDLEKAALAAKKKQMLAAYMDSEGLEREAKRPQKVV